MTYTEAREYISSRKALGIRPGLERMYRLAEKLGNPQKKLKIIHVAGTNGKGSVSTMIASAMISSGKRTGLYISPYVCDFRERMQINGQMINKDELSEITKEIKSLIDADLVLRDEITEFELITCIAFLWFVRNECDVVVLEVGLGGRLDATNVIDSPLCSVIMRVDFDHTAILGNEISQIAAEKAGIIKPGCPVVMFPDQPVDVARVIRNRAKELGCNLIVPDISAMKTGNISFDGTLVSYRELEYMVPLLGKHQTLNSITAVEALMICGVEKRHIQNGIANAAIPARLELVSKTPPVIIDGAHNPNGAAALAQAISDLMPGQRMSGVMGMLADKDYQTAVQLLAPLFDKIYTVAPNNPRALPADKLAECVAQYTKSESCVSVQEALEKAKKHNMPLVVFGSLYLAEEARRYLI